MNENENVVGSKTAAEFSRKFSKFQQEQEIREILKAIEEMDIPPEAYQFNHECEPPRSKLSVFWEDFKEVLSVFWGICDFILRAILAFTSVALIGLTLKWVFDALF